MANKQENDTRNVILKQISTLPHLKGDYTQCLVDFDNFEFRLMCALRPNPELLGCLTGATDVNQPETARPDKAARELLIAEMVRQAERRIAKVQLETEIASWKKYDDFILQSGLLLTAIVSIIDSGSNAYSLVQADKVGTVKSIMASLRNR